MSIDISSEHMAFFAFNESHYLETRELIEGLRILKDKSSVNHVDSKPVDKNYSLKGGKDTKFLNLQTFGKKDDLPKKSCLMVPKEEGSSERIEVRKAKSVHFADSHGYALASVSTLFDCEDDPFGFTRSTSTPLVERSSFPILNKKQNFKSDKKNKLLNFVQPVTLPDYQQKILTNNVTLENVVFRNFSIYGTVVVRNLDFEKHVSIRYTADEWKTNHDAKGVYLPGSNNGRSDTFSFDIPIPSGNEERCVIEFCIRFDTPQGTFWDNNNGQNYRVLCYRNMFSPVIHDNPDGFVLGPSSRKFAGYNS